MTTELAEHRSLAPSSAAGLLLALVGPALYLLVLGPALVGARTGQAVEAVIGLAVMWAIALAVLLLVRRGEGRPLASIGFQRPTWGIVLMAVGIGVVLSLAVPALSVLAAAVLPAEPEGSVAAAATIPWGVMLLAVVTAGVTEEILFRGYALERLLEWSGSRWLSSVIALGFFTAIHTTGWNLAHVVGVVIPLGAALTLLYWWRRNLILVMLVHVVVNLPLVFLAAAP